MIGRLWHGWTTKANAEAYQGLLLRDVLPGIARLNGSRGAYLLRREARKPREQLLHFRIGPKRQIDIGRTPHRAVQDLADRVAHHFDWQRLGDEARCAELDAAANDRRILIA